MASKPAGGPAIYWANRRAGRARVLGCGGGDRPSRTVLFDLGGGFYYSGTGSGYPCAMVFQAAFPPEHTAVVHGTTRTPRACITRTPSAYALAALPAYA